MTLFSHMTTLDWIVIGILWYVTMSIVLSFLAEARGRSTFGWFLLSLIISPLVALFVLLRRPKWTPKGHTDPLTDIYVMDCPACEGTGRRKLRPDPRET